MANPEMLYIIDVLRKYSTKEKPLSISEIENKLCIEHYHGSPEIMGRKTSTIDRHLKVLSESGMEPECPSDRKNDIYPETETDRKNRMVQEAQARKNSDADSEISSDPNHVLGFRIHRCKRDKDGSFVPYEKNDKKGPTQYYYYESLFDDAEISLLTNLLDAIYSLSSKEYKALTAKLNALLPGAAGNKNALPNHIVRQNLDEFNSYLLENIRILNELIQNKKLAVIQNCYYDENQHLVPYPAPKDKEKIIRPVKLLFSNGYCYLIAVEYSSSKNEFFSVHYRVDRLGSVRPVDDGDKLPKPNIRITDYKYKEPENPSTYRQCHPSMFGDDEVEANFLIIQEPFMLNVLTDYFGSCAKIRKTTPYILGRYLPETAKKDSDSWLHVTVKASRGGLCRFAVQFCRSVRMIYPPELAESIREELKNGLQLYS